MKNYQNLSFLSCVILALMLALGTGSWFSTPAFSATIVIEDFETGAYSSQWSFSGTDSGTDVSANHAKHGSYGSGDVEWIFRTDFQLMLGDRLQIWARPSHDSGGRFYLGFGADDSGTSSFVLAPSTGDIRFQNNPSYGHQELNFQSQSFTENQWYFAEVVLETTGAIVGNLYSSDGETLLNSLVAQGVTRTTGGIALRSFGGWSFDTLQVVRPAVVPVPAALPLFATGIVAMGLIGLWRSRRSRQQA